MHACGAVIRRFERFRISATRVRTPPYIGYYLPRCISQNFVVQMISKQNRTFTILCLSSQRFQSKHLKKIWSRNPQATGTRPSVSPEGLKVTALLLAGQTLYIRSKSRSQIAQMKCPQNLVDCHPNHGFQNFHW